MAAGDQRPGGPATDVRFDELSALPSTSQETTLMCISNYLGGGLMSNANWQGLPLRDLLTAAGLAKRREPGHVLRGGWLHRCLSTR